MKPRQTVRITIDCAMLLLLPFLMAFEPLGRKAHEWLGAGMLVLFFVHHILNLKWYGGLKKGHWTAMRMFQTAVNILLLLAMLAALVSGMAMSRYVFQFLHIPGGRALYRSIHMASVYWSFLLMGLHLGLHWNIFLALGRKLRKGKPLPRWLRYTLRTLTAATALYGLRCFINQNIPSYLFLQVEFAFFAAGKSLPFVIANLSSILILWAAVGYLLLKRPLSKRK